MVTPSIALPQNFEVPPGPNGIQLPAGGGSLINNSPGTIYIVALQEDIGNIARAFALVNGASLPWGVGVTCYGFLAATATVASSLYISPIQSSAFPIPQIVGVTGIPLKVLTKAFLSVTVDTIILPAPGLGLYYRIYGGLVTNQAAAGTTGIKFIAGGVDMDFVSAMTQGNANHAVIPLTGISADANTAITAQAGGGAAAFGGVYYTLETV